MRDRSTPTPWRADGCTIYGPNGEVVAVCRQAKPQNTMIADANARRIVEAVNRAAPEPKTEREMTR